MKLFGRTVSLLAAVIVVLAGAPGGAQQAPPPTASSRAPASLAEAERQQKPALLNQYCITCHNQRLKTAGLSVPCSMLSRRISKAASIARQRRVQALTRRRCTV
jgi:cytochrome c5